MNTDKNIPDAETRAKNVARLREICLQFDHLNMMLEQASAIAQAELHNSPLYVHRRERIKRKLEAYQQQHFNG